MFTKTTAFENADIPLSLINELNYLYTEHKDIFQKLWQPLSRHSKATVLNEYYQRSAYIKEAYSPDHTPLPGHYLIDYSDNALLLIERIIANNLDIYPQLTPRLRQDLMRGVATQDEETNTPPA